MNACQKTRDNKNKAQQPSEKDEWQTKQKKHKKKSQTWNYHCCLVLCDYCGFSVSSLLLYNKLFTFLTFACDSSIFFFSDFFFILYVSCFRYSIRFYMLLFFFCLSLIFSCLCNRDRFEYHLDTSGIFSGIVFWFVFYFVFFPLAKNLLCIFMRFLTLLQH